MCLLGSTRRLRNAPTTSVSFVLHRRSSSTVLSKLNTWCHAPAEEATRLPPGVKDPADLASLADGEALFQAALAAAIDRHQADGR